MNLVFILMGITGITLFTGCFIFWMIHLYKHSNKMRVNMKKAKKRYQFDKASEEYYVEFYKRQFVKDVFLMISALLEWYSLSSLILHDLLPRSDIILEYVDNYEIKFNICSEGNFTRYIELSNFSWFRLQQSLIESSNASTFMSTVFLIGLMRLKTAELKFRNPWERIKKRLRNSLIINAGLCCIILIPTLSSYTCPIAMLLGGILAPIYLIQFIREVNKLQAALAQYSRERLVQFGNNRKEVNQLRRFKIMSNILCFGSTCFLITLLYEKINIATPLVLYYGQCFFPLTYHFQYIPILHTATQQLILFKTLSYVSSIKLALEIFTGIILFFPFTLITLGIIIYQIYYHRIRKAPTRFQVDLEKRLIQPK